MTSEEVEKLKVMPVSERIKKYFPLKRGGKLTQQQYDWILALGIERSGKADRSGSDGGIQAQAVGTGGLGEGMGKVHEPPHEYTTHPTTEIGGSQKERLLTVLSDGEWHTTVEIGERVYGFHSGIYRIGARIHDLKKDGYDIHSQATDNKAIWRYRLQKSSQMTSTRSY